MAFIYDASGYASGAVELPHDDDYDIGPVVALQHVTKRLRRKARAHERLARLRYSHSLRCWNTERGAHHHGAWIALEKMADELEGV